MNKLLNVLVISPSESSRGRDLLIQLEASPAVNVMVVNAIMLRDNNDISKYADFLNLSRIPIVHGRSLSAPEIGCTLSHNRAREVVMTLPTGAVILEDDAVIPDLKEFVEICTEFLRREIDKPSLLNLHLDELSKTMLHSRSKIVRRFAPSPLAVGYALTPSASLKLLTANTPISFMGDWPPTKLRYFSVTDNVVIHGQGNLPNFLGPAELRKHSRTLGMQVFSLLHFIKHRSEFTSFSEWLTCMYIPRIRNTVDRLFMFFLTITRHVTEIKR